MGRPHGSRTLLAVSGALAILLAALAVVQYRWSTRVAAADRQRETEHLESAASLFANEFNGIAGQAAEFLQNDGWAALRSGDRLAPVPKLIGELYYLDIPLEGAPKARRLTDQGIFAPSPVPEWIDMPRCFAHAIEQPPALVTPVYGGSIYDSVQRYGLKLDPRKAPMEMILVDRMEPKPTEN
jgi:hypothetical protein